VEKDASVALEPDFAPRLAGALVERGHRLMNAGDTPLFGGGQVIYRMKDGYCAASDPRKDGLAVGF
jgi:gamma-glutamyltranspeptidase/glutathione hydrolase